MKTRVAIIVLLGLTLAMQVIIFYRQRRPPLPVTTPQTRNAPNGSKIEISDLPLIGSKNAKLVLVEFSDYECPFCARHEESVARELENKYIEPGTMSHAFINNPLPIHPNARNLAMAGICAGQQDLYWKMHGLLFIEKPKTREEILGIAKNLPLNIGTFEQCLNEPSKLEAKLERDIAIAKKFDLTGTPSFAVGTFDSVGNIEVKKFVIGAVPFGVFQKTIDEVLEAGKPH